MDITWVFELVIAILGCILLNVIIPFIKGKVTEQEYAELLLYIDIAVSAAEQIYVGSGRGKEKKAYVIKWLMDRGFSVDDKRIDAMIESAVYELKEAAK